VALAVRGFAEGLGATRRLSGAVGVLALLALPLASGNIADRIGLAALLSFSAATTAALFELLSQPQRTQRSDQNPPDADSRSWTLVFLILIALPLAASQSWFKGSTVIAAGDETLPNGTAWTNHLFDAWVWSGSNLGGPGALQLQLPWALILRIVTTLGGSEGLAQRVWLTTLFVGVAISAAIVARALGLAPLGGFVAGTVYAFNPFTMSSGGGNVVPVFLSTQIAIALFATSVFLVARRRVGILKGALLLASTAPLLGFIFQTPPELGVTLLALPSSIGVAVWLWGRPALLKCLQTVGLGLPLLLLLSAYWIVPGTLQATTAATALLSGIDTWSFTEVRATLSNAFWLNTHWTWLHSDYVPYAVNYGQFPLRFLIYVLPAAVLGVLCIRRLWIGIESRFANDGLAVALPLIVGSLLVIYLSTGTRFPAGPVFTWLYGLPYGWILREPGRFLVVAALAYSLLAGILVTHLLRLSQLRWDQVWAPATHHLARGIRLMTSSRSPGVIALVSLSSLAIVTSYPFITGEVIPDDRGKFLPSAHVNFPGYWQSMADYINSPDRKDGALLVLPVDDFYQMPYRFGFYGAETFIPNLIDRHVLLPVPQGYFNATPGLAPAVGLTADYLRNHDWVSASRTLSVLQVAYVLVRGDIDQFPGRQIDLPQNYRDLALDPHLVLQKSFGPLSLFATDIQPQTGIRTASRFWTIQERAADLGMLTYIPSGFDLVTHSPIPGVPSIVVDRGDPIIEPGSEFRGALGGPVQDCQTAIPHASQVNADVIDKGGPGGGAFLELTSTDGIACVSQPLPWKSGPLLVELATRHISGDVPHICLLEIGPQRCSPLPDLPANATWSNYRAIAYPEPGTRSLVFYLTAGGDSLSINEFASVRLTSIAVRVSNSSGPLAKPGAPAAFLTVGGEGYSANWAGPAGGEHVLVDGLFDGWITTYPPGQPPNVHYMWTPFVTAGYMATMLGMLLAVLALAGHWYYKKRRLR